MKNTNDINRFAGDSWPIKSTIKINGKKVDLGGWDVYLYYTEIQTDEAATTIKVRINGVVESKDKAVVRFYPRETYCYNITESVPYRGLEVVGEHQYSIVREKEFYEQNNVGGYVLISGEYIVYDDQNEDHIGLQRYSTYIETMTHTVGTIGISTRAGL